MNRRSIPCPACGGPTSAELTSVEQSVILPRGFVGRHVTHRAAVLFCSRCDWADEFSNVLQAARDAARKAS